MAQCTSKQPGNHVRGSQTEADCPMCSPKAKSGTLPKPRVVENFADLEKGDVVYVRQDNMGKLKVKKATISGKTKTLLKVEGMDSVFDVKSGREKRTGAYASHFSQLMLPGAEASEAYSRSRRNDYLGAAKRDLDAVEHFKPEGEKYQSGSLASWTPERAAIAERAVTRTKMALLLNSQTVEDTLEPRTSTGAPYPYTDEDVQSISGTVTNAMAPLLNSMKGDYRQGMLRAFLPVSSRDNFKSLLSVTHMIAEDRDLAERQTATDAEDALIGQLERLQGYAK